MELPNEVLALIISFCSPPELLQISHVNRFCYFYSWDVLHSKYGYKRWKHTKSTIAEQLNALITHEAELFEVLSKYVACISVQDEEYPTLYHIRKRLDNEYQLHSLPFSISVMCHWSRHYQHLIDIFYDCISNLDKLADNINNFAFDIMRNTPGIIDPLQAWCYSFSIGSVEHEECAACSWHFNVDLPFPMDLTRTTQVFDCTAIEKNKFHAWLADLGIRRVIYTSFSSALAHCWHEMRFNLNQRVTSPPDNLANQFASIENLFHLLQFDMEPAIKTSVIHEFRENSDFTRVKKSHLADGYDWENTITPFCELKYYQQSCAHFVPHHSANDLLIGYKLFPDSVGSISIFKAFPVERNTSECVIYPSDEFLDSLPYDKLGASQIDAQMGRKSRLLYVEYEYSVGSRTWSVSLHYIMQESHKNAIFIV